MLLLQDESVTFFKIILQLTKASFQQVVTGDVLMKTQAVEGKIGLCHVILSTVNSRQLE